jgi:hypothetical protein
MGLTKCDNIINGTNKFIYKIIFIEFLSSMDGVQFIYKTIQIAIKMLKL